MPRMLYVDEVPDIRAHTVKTNSLENYNGVLGFHRIETLIKLVLVKKCSIQDVLMVLKV